MHRLRLLVREVVFAFVLMAGYSPQGGIAHGQDLRPAGGKHAPVSRPLPIKDADAGVLTATISGPEFADSTLFRGVEDPDSPVVKRLRTEYRLDDVVKG